MKTKLLRKLRNKAFKKFTIGIYYFIDRKYEYKVEQRQNDGKLQEVYYCTNFIKNKECPFCKKCIKASLNDSKSHQTADSALSYIRCATEMEVINLVMRKRADKENDRVNKLAYLYRYYEDKVIEKAKKEI
jgi:hypothetical protein